MAFTLTDSVRESLVKRMLVGLRQNSVFGGITDGKFTDGLEFGSSYKVPVITDATIINYTGTDMALQEAADQGVKVDIDQAKAFNVILDGVDGAQAVAMIEDYIDNGVYGLGQAFDQFIATKLADGAQVVGSNLGVSGTPIAIDESNVLDWVKAMANGIALNGANLDNSALVVPYHVAMSLTNALGGHSSRNADDQRKGFIDTIYGIDVYSSNNLADGQNNEKRALCFEQRALVWRDSAIAPVVYTPDGRFGDAAKALHMYGAAAALGKGIAVGHVVEA